MAYLIYTHGHCIGYATSLEDNVCQCGGKLIKTKTERYDYDTKTAHELTCLKCKGRYAFAEKD